MNSELSSHYGKAKEVPKKKPKVDRFEPIEAALIKKNKSDLIELLLEIAKEYDDVCKCLESTLSIEKPTDLLLADVESAIVRATGFDQRMINRNFNVDWQAYEEVKQGFLKLIELGQLTEVQSLALELMKRGSYQVMCSDEGMMSDEIEACLKPVIRAVKAGDATVAKHWATTMVAADRVGFICKNELGALSGKVKK